MKEHLLILLFVGIYTNSLSQNYHAIHGSGHVSSLNVANNPGSVVHSPYKWDLALFGTQVKSATNAFTIHDYSLLSSPANAAWELNAGEFARRADINTNTNLLNTRISLSRTKAIAFGANLRSYTRLRTSSFNFIDTLQTITNFFVINPNTTSYEANVLSSSWIELFGTYGQTVIDNDKERLNAGITLKISRGISGGFARVQNINIARVPQPGGAGYQAISGAVSYGYSSNYDPWISDSTQKFMDFLTHTQGGISFDLGVEYLIKTQAVNTFYDDEDYYEYDWKIGVSVLDIGFNRYTYGRESGAAAGPRANLTNTEMENKFSDVRGFPAFRDSLATVVTNFRGLGGKFTIINPMRLVINADRYIKNNFYLNAELSVNLSPLAGDQRFFARELTFLTVTPRWEKPNLGAYLPVQYNNAGKFWVGAAVKAGPLLLGVHNLANVFSKNKMQNGGGYLAILLHPWKKNESKVDKRLDCPDQ
ncbi:MAG TPA: hypothetical protein VJ647_01330 [Chitinophagaceae bacterium]|nr:hypothetical protein [Chitinophagaceae bacterium]